MTDPARQPLESLPAIPWFLRSRTHLFLTLTVVLGLPLAAFTSGIVWNSQRTLHAQAVQQNMTAARLAAQVLESHFGGLERYVEHAGKSHTLANALVQKDSAAGRPWLERFLADNPAFDRVFVTDEQGVILFDWPEDEAVVGRSFAYRDWYKTVSVLDRACVSEVYRRAALDKAAIVAVAAPVRVATNERVGYIVAQHRIDKLAERLIAIEPGQGGKISLIDQHQHLIEPRGEAPPDLPALESHPAALAMQVSERDSFDARDPQSNEPNVFSVARVPSIGWVVLAQQPLAIVLAPALKLQHGILAMSALCLCSVLLLSFAWLNVYRRQHLAVLTLQRHKDLLSGMIVHDLRNPLGVTLVSIEEAQHGLSKPGVDIREDLDSALAGARRTLELVNVILDVMRMEDGVFHLNRAKDDLVGMVQEKVAQHRSLAKAGAVEIEAQLPANPAKLDVDSTLMRRVVDNLIVNAIKHTPRGGKIEVRLESNASGDRASLSVVDNGEGIPAEALPRLFQKYGRVNGQKMNGPHDTGLGLLFCRMAVEMHGGTIGAQSSPGKGTSIRIELPCT